MIIRVAIDNLVIVEHAEFEPGPGLTTVTGETGAGKTLLATAVQLLFGGDANAAHVAAGADHAWVEGEFDVGDEFWADPTVETLAGLRPDEDGPLVLARRVDAGGRSRAMAWGRTVAKADLASAGALLVASAGQHVQRRLLSPAFQRDAVDRAGGDGAAELLEAMRGAWRELDAARAELARVEADVAAAAERAEQVRDDLERIDALAPSADDKDGLLAERARARGHEQLVEALAEAVAALDGGGSDAAGGAIDLVGRAWSHAQAGAEVDEGVADVAGTLLGAQEALGDAARELASRLGELDGGPRSLDDIEERLAAYDELERRFGGTVESVLARRVELARQRELIDGGAAALEAANSMHAAAQEACERTALLLTEVRRSTAARLSADVAASLAELGMHDSVFEVAIEPAALGPSGTDRVELRLAPAAGIELRPVAQVASGGELSRIALALLVASGVTEAGTLVFDEIDAGIGGHTAHAIASLLRRLAEHQQVICITHLPQVAARASTHVVIDKQAGRTSMRPLCTEDAVLDELCRMLGAPADDEHARTHARGLRGPRVARGPSRSELTLAVD